jgi:hypothetical protein
MIADNSTAGQPLDGSAGTLGFAYHLYDLREQSVGPHALRLHHKAARPVDRSSGDLGIDRLFYWDGLAANHRFVDGAAALDDHSVNGDLLARTNTQLVAYTNVRQVHILVRAIRGDATGCLRSEAEQRFDCAACLASGLELEDLPEENQHRNHSRRFEVEAELPGPIPKRGGKDLRQKYGRNTVEISRA